MIATTPRSGAASFAKNVFWNWLAPAASIAGAFLVSPYMIRRLGDEGYGVWSLAFSMVEYLALLDMGFRSATVKYSAHHRTLGEPDKVNEVINASLLYFFYMAAAVIVLTVAASRFVGRFFVVSAAHEREFGVLVLLLGCNFAVSLIGSVFQAGLEGFGRFDLSGRTAICFTVTRILGTVGVLVAGGSLLSLGGWIVLTQFASHVMNLLQFRAVFPELRISPKFMKRKMLGSLARYGVHTVTATAALQLLYQGPPVLIGHLRSAAAVGYFSIPVRLMQTTGAEVTYRVSSVTGSRAAELCAKGDMEAIGRLGVYTNRYCLALFMPVAIFLTIFGRDFIKVWIGPAWAETAGPLLVPFVISTALAVCAQLNTTSILYGLAEHRWIARSLLAEGILSMGALVPVIRHSGIEGAAWTIAILSLLNRGLFTPWVLCRSLGRKTGPYLVSILAAPLATGIPVFALAWGARSTVLPGRNWAQLTAAGCCLSLVYGLVAFFTCLEKEHRDLALAAALERLRRFR